MSQAPLRVVGKEENTDKKRALEAALSQIDRAFGKGSVMKLGQREATVEADTISTGSLGLDVALGVGGGTTGAATAEATAKPTEAPTQAPTSAPTEAPTAAPAATEAAPTATP